MACPVWLGRTWRFQRTWRTKKSTPHARELENKGKKRKKYLKKVVNLNTEWR